MKKKKPEKNMFFFFILFPDIVSHCFLIVLQDYSTVLKLKFHKGVPIFPFVGGSFSKLSLFLFTV